MPTADETQLGADHGASILPSSETIEICASYEWANDASGIPRVVENLDPRGLGAEGPVHSKGSPPALSPQFHAGERLSSS